MARELTVSDHLREALKAVKSAGDALGRIDLRTTPGAARGAVRAARDANTAQQRQLTVALNAATPKAAPVPPRKAAPAKKGAAAKKPVAKKAPVVKKGAAKKTPAVKKAVAAERRATNKAAVKKTGAAKAAKKATESPTG